MPVARSIGVTVAGVVAGVVAASIPLRTYAILPFGVMAMACGEVPTAIGLPGLSVAVAMGTTLPGDPSSSPPTATT